MDQQYVKLQNFSFKISVDLSWYQSKGRLYHSPQI